MLKTLTLMTGLTLTGCAMGKGGIPAATADTKGDGFLNGAWRIVQP